MGDGHSCGWRFFCRDDSAVRWMIACVVLSNYLVDEKCLDE